jgi:hypothetical protein
MPTPAFTSNSLFGPPYIAAVVMYAILYAAHVGLSSWLRFEKPSPKGCSRGQSGLAGLAAAAGFPLGMGLVLLVIAAFGNARPDDQVLFRNRSIFLGLLYAGIMTIGLVAAGISSGGPARWGGKVKPTRDNINWD